GCGNDTAGDSGGGSPVATERPDPGFDPDDPAYDVAPESRAPDARRLSLLGTAAGFRVRRAALVGLKPGPMARTAIARIWNELIMPDRRYWRLTPGQRALYALQLAEFEIREGGFDQLWFEASGYVAPDLRAAAELVGATDHAAIYRDAGALFKGGITPRDQFERQAIVSSFPDAAVTRLNERYANLRLHRRTSLGLILGTYVRTHLDEFIAE
ncbi:MAG TPA: DUF4375 domain-containing protein, partial [Solirubrobacteraceae bacterium]